MHYTEIRFFVLFYELKNTFVTLLYLSSLFTNKWAVLSSAQTDQSQFSFSAGFRHEIEHALSGAGFWHPKNLAPTWLRRWLRLLLMGVLSRTKIWLFLR